MGHVDRASEPLRVLCGERESARWPVRTQTPLRYVLLFPVRKIPSVIYRKDADRAAGARQGAAGALGGATLAMAVGLSAGRLVSTGGICRCTHT